MLGPEMLAVDDGFDELFLRNVNVHIERMDYDHIWIGLYSDGHAVHLNLFAEGEGSMRGTLDVSVEPDKHMAARLARRDGGGS